jgi:hypothetical protein
VRDCGWFLLGARVIVTARTLIAAALLCAPAVIGSCASSDGGIDRAVAELSNPVDIDCTSGGPVLILDRRLAAVVELDLEARSLKLVSQGDRVGEGTQLRPPIAFARSRKGPHAFVLSEGSGERAVLRVEVPSGDRRMVAELTDDASLSLDQVLAMDLTPSEGRLLMTDAASGLVSLDIASGRLSSVHGRQPISSDVELVGTPYDIMATDEQHVWVAQDFRNSLQQIDLQTGEIVKERILSEGSPIDLARMATPGHVAVMIHAGTDYGLWDVDLETGATSELSTVTRGAGPALKRPTRFCVDATAKRALVIDTDSHVLWSVDLVSGDRQEVIGL